MPESAAVYRRAVQEALATLAFQHRTLAPYASSGLTEDQERELALYVHALQARHVPADVLARAAESWIVDQDDPPFPRVGLFAAYAAKIAAQVARERGAGAELAPAGDRPEAIARTGWIQYPRDDDRGGLAWDTPRRRFAVRHDGGVLGLGDRDVDAMWRGAVRWSYDPPHGPLAWNDLTQTVVRDRPSLADRNLRRDLERQARALEGGR